MFQEIFYHTQLIVYRNALECILIFLFDCVCSTVSKKSEFHVAVLMSTVALVIM